MEQPLEVYSEESVDGSHKLNFELGRNQTLESMLDPWVLGEVDEVFNVEA